MVEADSEDVCELKAEGAQLSSGNVGSNQSMGNVLFIAVYFLIIFCECISNINVHVLLYPLR